MKKKTVVFTNIGTRDTHDVLEDLEMIGVDEVVAVTNETIEIKITDRIAIIQKMMYNRDFV